MRPVRSRGRVARVLAAVAAGGLAAACTAGTGGPGAGGPKAEAKQTITLWHGFSAPNEVKAFSMALAGFHKLHPNITVKAVKGQDDEKIIQAIRGGTPPDVVSSFTTDNVGEFCGSGAWQDLTPRLTADKVDMARFPAAVRAYTAYKGKRCALPLLADAYGLYYNKKLLAQAGIAGPPKTMSELAADAKRLTKRNPDGSIKTAGFMPTMNYYEYVPQHLAPLWDAHWTGPNGKSDLAADPAWTAMLTWNKKLIDWYGYDKLNTFRHGLGQEFSADNPFEKGKVAMAIDGEWRTKMIADEAKGLDYGTAPAPVADNKQNLYGGGFITGTIIGIPRGSRHADAAWELVKYLTTNTDALVTLADNIHNVPSTLPALRSPKLAKDPQFQTFLNIFGSPHSATNPASPNGGAYITTFQSFVTDSYEPGKAGNLAAGLRATDTKIDRATKLAGQ
ncbi:MAG TPA: ABC transporter substrate-binding protein [Streptosporangiaceae bacterium]